MMAFGLSAIYNYFLYSVAKKTFDPLNYFLTYLKAFDKVPHRRLLHKMHRHRISEKVIKWVESFLSNRIQKVIVIGTESKCHHVTSGIA
jgi:hypothetical protein